MDAWWNYGYNLLLLQEKTRWDDGVNEMREGNILEDPLIFMVFLIGWLGGTLIALYIRGLWIQRQIGG